MLCKQAAVRQPPSFRRLDRILIGWSPSVIPGVRCNTLSHLHTWARSRAIIFWWLLCNLFISVFPLPSLRWFCSMIKHFQIFNRSLSPLVHVMYLSRVQKTQLIPNKHGGNTWNRWICLPNELVDMCGLWQCGHVVTLRWWRHCVLWSHHIAASHGHSHTATAYCSVVTSIVTPGLSPVSVSSCQRDSARRRLLPGLYPCSKCQLTFSQFRIYRIYILRHYSSPSPVTCWKL